MRAIISFSPRVSHVRITLILCPNVVIAFMMIVFVIATGKSIFFHYLEVIPAADMVVFFCFCFGLLVL